MLIGSSLMVLRNSQDVRIIDLIIEIIMTLIFFGIGRIVPQYFEPIKLFAENKKIIK